MSPLKILLIVVYYYLIAFSEAQSYFDPSSDNDFDESNNFAESGDYVVHEEEEDADPTPTLILSHVIFRHGNRTPDSFQELYPKDPYLNETYYPYGLGQLTNAGKLREFSIGTTLRERYSHFLSNIFLQSEVEAVSTDYNRTKASLELALAGLFPPANEQIWNSRLMWQPIPYNFLPRNQDILLMGILCPKYLTMYEDAQNSWEIKKELKKFRKVFNYVSSHTGLKVTTFQHIYNLYFGLSTEQEYGFPLPQWTRPVWPKVITDIAIREYYVLMHDTHMRQIASGYLLKKIIDDTMAKIKRKNVKKIYLYSAHENNVAQLLILLGVFRPHVPNYGAHVILEVHQVGGAFGIKVFYQNWERARPELLRIPECEELCPLEKFISMFQKYLPKGDMCGNK